MQLRDMFRYLGFQRFDFAGGAADGELSLIVGCRWQLVGPGGFALGSGDFDPLRTDDHALAFYETTASPGAPRVTDVDVAPNGDLSVTMSGGHRIDAWPNQHPTEMDEDQWLLLVHEGGSEAVHFTGGRGFV